MAASSKHLTRLGVPSYCSMSVAKVSSYSGGIRRKARGQRQTPWEEIMSNTEIRWADVVFENDGGAIVDPWG